MVIFISLFSSTLNFWSYYLRRICPSSSYIYLNTCSYYCRLFFFFFFLPYGLYHITTLLSSYIWGSNCSSFDLGVPSHWLFWVLNNSSFTFFFSITLFLEPQDILGLSYIFSSPTLKLTTAQRTHYYFSYFLKIVFGNLVWILVMQRVTGLSLLPDSLTGQS